MLGLAALGWGSSTTLSAFALRQMGAIDLLAVEILSGGAVIWTVALVRMRSSLTTPHWKTFALLGLCEPGLTYLLANEGLRHDSAATASLLFAMEAVLVVPLAAVFLGERVSRVTLRALALGLLGAVIVGAGAQGGRDSLLGHALILGATLGAAAYSVLARHSADRAPALVATTYQLLAAVAIAVPLAVLLHVSRGKGLPAVNLAHWSASVAAGMAGVAVPFLLYNRAVAVVRATIAIGVLNLIPLIGFITAVIFLGETPTAVEMLGGLLVLVSIALIARNETQASSPSAGQAKLNP
jgi:drug/metabolite transporter (DMT)-like permease